MQTGPKLASDELFHILGEFPTPGSHSAASVDGTLVGSQRPSIDATEAGEAPNWEAIRLFMHGHQPREASPDRPQDTASILGDLNAYTGVLTPPVSPQQSDDECSTESLAILTATFEAQLASVRAGARELTAELIRHLDGRGSKIDALVVASVRKAAAHAGEAAAMVSWFRATKLQRTTRADVQQSPTGTSVSTSSRSPVENSDRRCAHPKSYGQLQEQARAPTAPASSSPSPSRRVSHIDPAKPLPCPPAPVGRERSSSVVRHQQTHALVRSSTEPKRPGPSSASPPSLPKLLPSRGLFMSRTARIVSPAQLTTRIANPALDSEPPTTATARVPRKASLRSLLHVL